MIGHLEEAATCNCCFAYVSPPASAQMNTTALAVADRLLPALRIAGLIDP